MLTAHDQDLNAPTVTQLQHALDAANTRIAALENTYQEQVQIQEEYKSALAHVTESIHPYFEALQKHLEALHQHYTDLLQQSRHETIQAQVRHQEWQASLKKVSEGVREAYKAREEEGRPYRARIAALKEENRILRAQVGWDPPADSDEDEWDDEEVGASEGRGRGSRTSQPDSSGGPGPQGLVLP